MTSVYESSSWPLHDTYICASLFAPSSKWDERKLNKANIFYLQAAQQDRMPDGHQTVPLQTSCRCGGSDCLELTEDMSTKCVWRKNWCFLLISVVPLLGWWQKWWSGHSQLSGRPQYLRLWSIEVLSRSLCLPALPLLLPLLEEADVVGCRMQVVNPPNLPISAPWMQEKILLDYVYITLGNDFDSSLVCSHRHCEEK